MIKENTPKASLADIRTINVSKDMFLCLKSMGVPKVLPMRELVKLLEKSRPLASLA